MQDTSMQELVRQIRVRLRLAMNGVASASMREKGLHYKLNFGVSIPKLKEMAQDLPHEGELAEALWRQDVREMKILAPMLQPVDEFTPEQAEQWAVEAPNQEIRELYAMHLLQHLPYAGELAAGWIGREETSYAILGYLVYARLFRKAAMLQGEAGETFLRRARQALDTEEAVTQQTEQVLDAEETVTQQAEEAPGGKKAEVQRAAMLALKQYGRQSADQAMLVLDCLAGFRHSGIPEKEMWYEELQFEFEYYG